MTLDDLQGFNDRNALLRKKVDLRSLHQKNWNYEGRPAYILPLIVCA